MITAPKSVGFDICGTDVPEVLDRTNLYSACAPDHSNAWCLGDEVDLTEYHPAQVPGHSDGGTSRVHRGENRS